MYVSADYSEWPCISSCIYVDKFYYTTPYSTAILLLSYSPNSCGGMLQTVIRKLQKSTVCIITLGGHLNHYRLLFPLSQDWIMMAAYVLYILASLAYVKDHLGSSTSARDDVHSYKTRGGTALDKPRCRLSKTLMGIVFLSWPWRSSSESGHWLSFMVIEGG